MEINEKIIALGVCRKGCKIVEHMLGKIESVECADVRFQAEADIFNLFNAQ